MLIQKIPGAGGSFYYTIGTTKFAMLHAWHPTSAQHGNTYSLILEPYAYQEHGQDWVLSVNHTSGQQSGRLLNAINHDKSIRLPRDEFIRLYALVYTNALADEALVPVS